MPRCGFRDDALLFDAAQLELRPAAGAQCHHGKAGEKRADGDEEGDNQVESPRQVAELVTKPS